MKFLKFLFERFCFFGTLTATSMERHSPTYTFPKQPLPSNPFRTISSGSICGTVNAFLIFFSLDFDPFSFLVFSFVVAGALSAMVDETKLTRKCLVDFYGWPFKE